MKRQVGGIRFNSLNVQFRKTNFVFDRGIYFSAFSFLLIILPDDNDFASIKQGWVSLPSSLLFDNNSENSLMTSF